MERRNVANIDPYGKPASWEDLTVEAAGMVSAEVHNELPDVVRLFADFVEESRNHDMDMKILLCEAHEEL